MRNRTRNSYSIVSDKSPPVTVVVINYNGGKYLLKCIQSLLLTKYDNFKVTILDNASQDSSIDDILNIFPNVNIIRLDKNVGFAGGASFAVNSIQDEYIVLLNNDIYVQPDWLHKLVETAEDNPNAIMIGLRVRNPTTGFAQAHITFPLIASRIMDINEIRLNYSGLVESSYAAGGACLIRRNEALSIGNFDSDYFLFWEEIDFAWRAWLCGYRVLIDLNTCVFHDNGRTIRTFTLRNRSYYSNRNRIITYFKYLSNYLLLMGVLGEVIYGSMMLLRSLKNSTTYFLLQGYLMAILWIFKNFKIVICKRLLMKQICKYWGLLPPCTITTKVHFGKISQYIVYGTPSSL